MQIAIIAIISICISLLGAWAIYLFNASEKLKKSISDMQNLYNNALQQLENQKQINSELEKDAIILQQNNISMSQNILQLQNYKDGYYEMQNKVASLQAMYDSQQKAMNLIDQKRHEDAERLKNITISSIKEISDNLLNQNNKTTQDLTKITEEKTKTAINDSQMRTEQITQDLVKKYEDIAKQLHAVSQQNQKQDGAIKKIQDIFKSSAATGAQGELILENALTHAGFIRGIDFELQYVTKNGKYKPDAVLFLTNDDIMIIDSKSSTFFLPDGEMTDEARSAKIKESMQKHIKDLSSKDYKNAVLESLTKTHERFTKNAPRNVHLFMFLASELFIEAAIKSFGGGAFYAECVKSQIYPCGPITLCYALDIAKISKTQYHSDKNLQNILKEVKVLIERVSKLEEHSLSIIKEYNDMGKKIEEFSGSLNRMFIPQRKKIEKLMNSDIQVQNETSFAMQKDELIEEGSEEDKLFSLEH